MPTSHSEVWKRIIACEKEVQELNTIMSKKKLSKKQKILHQTRVRYILDFYLPTLDKKFGEETPTFE
jgi:hypothetical protein